MDALSNVLNKQSYLLAFPGDAVHQNELVTFQLIHSLPDKQARCFKKLTLEFLETCQQPHEVEKYAQRSRALREQGNRIFNDKTTNPLASQSERLLGACELYTKAILEAENAFEELCLGYANRGMALQEFGYYQQAYDDCASALEFGYPKKNQHKLIMRQAFCASKMGDFENLAEHINFLDEMKLNESFSQQLEQLKKEVPSKQSNPALNKAQTTSDTIIKKHKVVKGVGIRGRYLVATESIMKGELLIKEPALCFVPTSEIQICQQCACTLMCTPIPCPLCHQRTVYCSRRCRQLHADIHRFECAAYKMGLVEILGVSYLALRLVIVNMPQWLGHLAKRANANTQQLWESLMEMTDEEQDPQWMHMSMTSHLNKLPATDSIRTYHTLCANLLQTLLYKSTNFYDQLLDCTSASAEDWHVVLGALILRSAGQLLVNACAVPVVMPDLERSEFAMLQTTLWTRPYHLKRGALHKFEKLIVAMCMNLPNLSMANHACTSSICIKYDGPAVSCYAMHDIKEGEEIFNCYTVDCRNTMLCEREKELKKNYNFRCRCTKCLRVQPDEDYLTFHRYRCRNPRCFSTYVPKQTPKMENLCWWLSEEATMSLYCTVCGELQSLYEYNQFLDLIDRCKEIQIRRQLYKIFNELNYLLAYNSLKLSIAKEIVKSCFAAQDDGSMLDDTDYRQLLGIIKYLLNGTAVQWGCYSTVYTSKLTYLWDCIALGKYKCGMEEMQSMLAAVEYLREETKTVFINYYKDYIEAHYT
ncbi:SET and MYND domain-containing protein 4-like [Drosophila busckii]|uniref:SET and MYND domain-containing protein 4-like n=1 Tax=Drosophila busckii TaxID=30019 RepID=UPI00083F12CC|nr:SET and MYND domain-containing protein 4-like [Drosophila busckii]